MAKNITSASDTETVDRVSNANLVQKIDIFSFSV